jgi:probable F420-dependent oxidoreductase
MKFGLLFPFRNPPAKAVPWPRLYRDHLQLAVDADELGYDHVWLTEHHFVDDGYSPSLLPIAAAIAARTRRIRIGTFVLLLPLHDPLRVAEDAATVDIISDGRLDLGLGQGYRVGEFVGFEVSRKERGPRLEEGAEVIRRAWTEEGLTFHGRFTSITDVTLAPKPVQKPHPPIWIAARGPKSIDRAARHGHHLAGTGGADQQQMYDEALRRHGRRPEEHDIVQLRTVFVAETVEKAWDAAEAGIHHMWTYYGRWFTEARDLPGDEGFGAEIPPVGKLRHAETAALFGEPLIVGTPEDAVRMIEDYRKRTRVTHLCMATALPGVEPEKIRTSLELFAKEVIPHFRGTGS